MAVGRMSFTCRKALTIRPSPATPGPATIAGVWMPPSVVKPFTSREGAEPAWAQPGP